MSAGRHEYRSASPKSVALGRISGHAKRPEKIPVSLRGSRRDTVHWSPSLWTVLQIAQPSIPSALPSARALPRDANRYLRDLDADQTQFAEVLVIFSLVEL